AGQPHGARCCKLRRDGVAAVRLKRGGGRAAPCVVPHPASRPSPRRLPAPQRRPALRAPAARLLGLRRLHDPRLLPRARRRAAARRPAAPRRHSPRRGGGVRLRQPRRRRRRAQAADSRRQGGQPARADRHPRPPARRARPAPRCGVHTPRVRLAVEGARIQLYSAAFGWDRRPPVHRPVGQLCRDGRLLGVGRQKARRGGVRRCEEGG
ncbi:hypothetical protein EMIHUDRAFT_447936, partial [Emiliania huxleyi CCMP1516]|uniref:Uncharacterized protein n=2 Tax=Emiliania huxleyi TaxID=2903 RepID=A0A0D3J3L5_EMIH1